MRRGPANAPRVRLGALSLAVAGVFFVLYPAIRPFSDETSLQGAAAFASPAWIVAHTLAILGFILVALGLFALYGVLQDTAAERPAVMALITTWIGAGLTLPYDGAETFGLHVLGQEAIRQHSKVILANDVRYGPAILLFGPGLLLLGIGAILAAVAIWKSGALPKLGLGFPSPSDSPFIFRSSLTNQPIRVAHGLLVGAGCLSISAGMWQKGRETKG